MLNLRVPSGAKRRGEQVLLSFPYNNATGRISSYRELHILSIPAGL
jgi:hypothetical protein